MKAYNLPQMQILMYNLQADINFERACKTKNASTSLVFLASLGALASSESARSPGCYQTHLASSRCAPLDSRGVADMLMVTTTVGMLHRLQDTK